ncbi:unnamed protein product [Cuscuta europaea]|uniref:Uncharacterized protein n=1 Tax=Cuscuta europaea TaxID=41803 RepID=A0A9P0YVT9_CUSEU|nr:unnamed protein product [Cuscuta europaea]
MALLYKSSDFVNWVKAEEPFFSSENTGMWECPDFFPTHFPYEDSKFVLKVSLDDCKRDYYAIGSYGYPEDDVFIPDEGSVGFEDENSVCSSRLLMFDYGKYYASKTFLIAGYTPESRRILFGWVNESTDASIYTGAGWAGLQAIPRQVWLGASGKQLVQLPVEEIKQLRENQVSVPSAVLQAGSVVEVTGVMGSQADVELEFGDPMLEKAEELKPEWTTDPQELCSQMGASVRDSLGPFGLLVLASQDIQEFTAVFFRIFKKVDKYVVLMCSDQTRSSSNLDYDKTTYGAFLDADPLVEKLSLRCLIDHSIVESFGGGGKVCITSRVYPSTAIDAEAHLYAFNNGTVDISISSLNAWSMKKANIN